MAHKSIGSLCGVVGIVLSLGTTARADSQGQVTPVQPQRVELADALLPSQDAVGKRQFIQLAWNGVTNEIERVRMGVYDPLATSDLTLSWKTEAVVVRPGNLDGEGRLEWRGKDTLGYGDSGLVATFDGTLRDGKFEGQGRYWHRSGTVYEGAWSAGLMQGEGTLHLGDGRSYTGGFKAGLFNGSGQLAATDGTLFTGQFQAGHRHGPGVETTNKGMRFSSVWRQGKEDLSQRQVLVRPEDIEPTLAQQLAYPDLSFGVTMDRREQPGSYPYDGRNEGDVLIATPGVPGFMAAWRSGGAIARPASDLIGPERFHPANFLMSLENRGGAPVQVLGGYLAVQSSTPELDPYLEYVRNYDCGEPTLTKVRLFNYGWSDPINASVEGGIISRDAQRYLLALNVASLGGWPQAEFDLGPGIASASPALAALAANGLLCQGGAYALCAQTAASQGLFGPLADGVYHESSSIMADYYGIISYSWRDHTGQMQQKRSSLRAPVKIGRFVEQSECGEGDGYGSPFETPFMLPANRQNYRFPFTLFSMLQPGTVQNWNFQIDSEMASRHLFSVVLQLSDGREVASRPVDLTYFKAKSPW